jgi:hypothetical protein
MLHNNNIEDQLRQLDNQQQPDLGHMDEHWQQMQAMLQPAIAPLQKGLPKWMMNALSIVAIILLIGGAFLYLSTRKGGADNTGMSNGNVADEKNAVPVVVPVKDTMEKKSTVTKQLLSDKRRSDKPVNNSKYFSEEDAVFSNMKINFTPCETCPVKETDSVTTAVTRAQLFQHLFSALKKQDQQFVIDNSRDTLLACAEGSALLIPSGSLGGKSGIVFTVKEFYKESDIILNQLSTVSNKDQLVTGGMVELSATLDGKAVTIDPAKPLQWHLPDTSSSMSEMQLFDGESRRPVLYLPGKKTETWEEGLMDFSGTINWIPQYQYFSRKQIVTQVKVLNIIDQPFKIKEKRKGQIGYFIINEESMAVDKEQLKQMLKQKYGYYKIRLKSGIRNWFEGNTDGRAFDREYASNIGDSVWMDKETANRYKITWGSTRQIVVSSIATGNGLIDTSSKYYKLQPQASGLLKNIQNKYSVNVSKLGWINCDKFTNDPREKLQYAVNLGDSAKNYYTMMVFDNIKSIMNGYADGNRVVFNNVPKGENVKVISIGIDKTGKTVYALQPATINTQELSGLEFQSTSAPELKASLSKMDR